MLTIAITTPRSFPKCHFTEPGAQETPRNWFAPGLMNGVDIADHEVVAPLASGQ
jgi:hypothetical protein